MAAQRPDDWRAVAEMLIDALNSRDYDAIEDLPIHPELEFHSTIAASEGRIYQGSGWARAWAKAVDDAWEDFRIDIVDAQPVADDRAVVVFHVTGIARTSRVPLDQHTSQLWTWRDGLAWRNEGFSDATGAFRAAGVPPRPAQDPGGR